MFGCKFLYTSFAFYCISAFLRDRTDAGSVVAFWMQL